MADEADRETQDKGKLEGETQGDGENEEFGDGDGNEMDAQQATEDDVTSGGDATPEQKRSTRELVEEADDKRQASKMDEEHETQQAEDGKDEDDVMTSGSSDGEENTDDFYASDAEVDQDAQLTASRVMDAAEQSQNADDKDNCASTDHATVPRRADTGILQRQDERVVESLDVDATSFLRSLVVHEQQLQSDWQRVRDQHVLELDLHRITGWLSDSSIMLGQADPLLTSLAEALCGFGESARRLGDLVAERLRDRLSDTDNSKYF